ncbi:MerR family transcriptional regulator [Novosphingobium malaysiense]|uniref:Transcriptional regulator n=1 Tax=Novosphingobium malaysiense TaxID=1348853 RepID=A0A0B1ZQV2_9SPHN|nr:MerR family transcriptional regulator [Novosphingobium malaysiense]KHK91634.1 transcriptional regulator [Novosphingobium malaysiense]
MSGTQEQLVFDDGKDPEALRTIGEVARALGIKQHVLRYWEEQFPRLQPIKRSGGRRYYRPQDVALIAEIDRLVHREGYTLRGACKAISERARSSASGEAATEADANDIGANASLLEDLVSLRGMLADALAAA